MPDLDRKAHRERERFRRRFQPACVRLLFIGESPPASGRFFYRGDSGLYRAMLSAFERMDPSINDSNFLDVFRSSGCFLADLCGYPVDDLDRESRKAACLSSERSLSRTILRLQPVLIVTVVRSIESNVRRSAAAAGWSGPFLHLPYP